MTLLPFRSCISSIHLDVRSPGDLAPLVVLRPLKSVERVDARRRGFEADLREALPDLRRTQRLADFRVEACDDRRRRFRRGIHAPPLDRFVTGITGLRDRGKLRQHSGTLRAAVSRARAAARFSRDGMADGEQNITCTWPATRSTSAGAPPLYGTCVMSIPRRLLEELGREMLRARVARRGVVELARTRFRERDELLQRFDRQRRGTSA